MATEQAAELATLEEEVRACPLCDLSKTRTKAVPGEGPVDAEVMLIGEGPGFHEDKQGRPFVGPAGRLLNELLESIGLDRSKVYITNVVKCRPPNNNDPLPHQISACAPYLDRQLALIKPKVVVTLGRFSMARFFPGTSISRIHGQPRRIGNAHVIPMYHPAAALHQGALLAVVKSDFLKVKDVLEEARAAEARGEKEDEAVTPDEAPKQLGLFD